ncbi:uncharacterized protein [Musca autumnalis]|uniref:uncharacterized protein n=1 Tax=Musca autumnalis TaxID=221902 RepID=UPI003CF05867
MLRIFSLISTMMVLASARYYYDSVPNYYLPYPNQVSSDSFIETSDDDYVAIFGSYIDEWSSGAPMGNIHPASGPYSDIFIPGVAEFGFRNKRYAKYGLNYEIPLSCQRVKSGTEKRVTKG